MNEGRTRLELELKPSTIVLLDQLAARKGLNRASLVSWLVRGQDAIERNLETLAKQRCPWWRRHTYGRWYPLLGWRQARRCTACGWQDVH